MVSTVRSVLGRVVAILLCYYGWTAAATGSASCQEIKPKQFWAEAARTAKERLSGKSMDEQRVDNCKVPLALRGAKPRPDHCVDDVNTPSKR
jgi:hypothetical protein